MDWNNLYQDREKGWVLENFGLTYEMLAYKRQTLLCGIIQTFCMFCLTWLTSMNVILVTFMLSRRQYQDVYNYLSCYIVVVLLM
jgi:hypothetical protein